MRYILAALLIAGAAGCSNDKPEWTCYGKIESYECEILNGDSALKPTWYKHTYTLTNGRVAVDYTNYPVQGFIKDGYLFGYQKKDGHWYFNVQPDMEVSK